MQALTHLASISYALERYSACAYAGAVSFGSNLKRMRERRGLSQTELAKRLTELDPTERQFLPSYISELENERYNIKRSELQTVLRLCIALGCSIDALLVGVETAYDTAAGTVPPAPDLDPIDAQDRVLLKKLKDETTRRATDVFLLPESKWLRDWILARAATQPAFESEAETTPAREEAGTTSRRKSRRASGRMRGKRG